MTVFGGLVMVMLALAVVVFLLKRVPALKQLLPANLGQVHGSLAIGPRERIVLVEAAGEWMLVGVAPGQVRILKSLDASSAQAWLKDNAQAATHTPAWHRVLATKRMGLER